MPFPRISIFSVVLMAFFVLVAGLGASYPGSEGVAPLAVGVCGFCLAALERGSSDAMATASGRRAVLHLGWGAGFVLSLSMLGPFATIPAFLFGYLRWLSGFSLVFSTSLSLTTALVIGLGLIVLPSLML